MIIIGARALGHGRRTESLFAMLLGSYGISLLLVPRGILSDKPECLTLGLAAIASTFIIDAAFIAYGLVGNILDWRWQRPARFIGGALGVVIWVWVLILCGQFNASMSLQAICAFWFYVHSIIITSMAVANRPIPGTPGQQGGVG